MSRGDTQVYGVFVSELQRLKSARRPLSGHDLRWIRGLAFRTNTRDDNVEKMIDDTIAAVIPRAITERLKA